MDIGSKIKEIRIKKGITQKELAEKLGTSQQNLAQYECGKRNPKLETVKKIADALNVFMSDLINEEVDYTRPEPNTLAAHFDGDEYTGEELEEIRQFAEFVKSKRKDQEKN